MHQLTKERQEQKREITTLEKCELLSDGTILSTQKVLFLHTLMSKETVATDE